MSRAADLAERSGVDLDPTYFPMYFTGAFEARIVLVHLNPRLSQRLTGPRYADFEAVCRRAPTLRLPPLDDRSCLSFGLRPQAGPVSAAVRSHRLPR